MEINTYKFCYTILLIFSVFSIEAKLSDNINAIEKYDQKLQSFRFEGADIDTVMTQYCEWTDKIYLKTDQVQANITLKVDRLTTSESIQVVEAILAMNGIALVPMGDKFIKVVQANAGDLVGQGMSIDIDPQNDTEGSNKFVTAVIPLQNVQINEIQAAIQHILHSYGKILTLERSNSIMITDTADNVKRARELVEFIDQATAQIEQRIYKIIHADASDIADKIKEIIDAAKGEEEKPETQGNPYARTPNGLIRASANPQTPDKPSQASISNTESSNTVLIQGEVKVLADERTNIIIIFSQAENFTFFEKIIEVLDITVDPETTFEVVNLEYADAEELAGTLNSLIGSSGSNSQTRNNSSRSNTTRNSNQGSTRVRANSSDISEGITNLNRLSEETQILADIRSNSIILMGEKNDIRAIKEVISELDIKLEQVMIEAAIFEVTLNDNASSGIEWLTSKNGNAMAGGFGVTTFLGDSNSNTIPGMVAGALTYYEDLTDISTEIAVNLAASDSNVRLLSTPVIITTDNTEATLSVGEQRPVVTSTSTFGSSMGTQRSSYEYKDIGINLSVKPRINPNRVVVLEITQKADQVGSTIEIDGNDVPVILNREFEALISVPDRGTIVLGGMINTENRDSKTKIPLLGDIPFIGRHLFSNQGKQEVQTELIVLLTPYVMTTDVELKKETERRYDSSSMTSKDWPKKGWSDSNLKYRDTNKKQTDNQKKQQKSNIINYIQSMKLKSNTNN